MLFDKVRREREGEGEGEGEGALGSLFGKGRLFEDIKYMLTVNHKKSTGNARTLVPFMTQHLLELSCSKYILILISLIT